MALITSDCGHEGGGAGNYAVRDLWAHTDNGTVAASGSITALVGKEDVVMIVLAPC